MIRSFDGKTPKIAESAYVDDTAVVIGDVEIGEGSGVFPTAVIRADIRPIKIGRNTMIQDNAVVHADDPMEVGDNVIVGHSVVLHGAKIGNSCLIGNNATVLDGAKIGNYCVVGAGCVVSQGMQIPDNSMVVGVPGVIKRQISEEMKKRLQYGIQIYTELVKKYKKQSGSR